MKSKFFKTYSIGLSETYKKALENITKFPDNVISEAIKWINEDYEIKSKGLENYYVRDRIDRINTLCTTCNVTEEDFFGLFSFASFITRKVYELNDDLFDVVDDFVNSNLIPSELKDKVIYFFEATQDKCVKIAKQHIKDYYGDKSLPVIYNMDYSVNLRLIPKTPYDPSETPIEEYNPEKADLILTSTIELIINDGMNKNVFSFQLNFTELEDLIVRLQACQKEMRLLQTYYADHTVDDCLSKTQVDARE